MNNNARVYALRGAISAVGIDRANVSLIPPLTHRLARSQKEFLVILQRRRESSAFSANGNLQPDAEL